LAGAQPTPKELIHFFEFVRRGTGKTEKTAMKITRFGNEKSNIVLIQLVDERELSSMEHEVDLIRGLTDRDFGLIAVCVDDWNKDLSPWKAPSVYGNEDFGSGADETLSWVLNNVIFEANAEEDDKRRYILGGYSLAGLFALYSAYKTNVFERIAAASPSVWFPGFTEYAKENEINADYIYLSLGDKEEKTKNRTLASVGNCIRELAEYYDTVTDVTLEWNEGNHFAEPEVRMAKGFAYLINRNWKMRETASGHPVHTPSR